MTTPMPDTALPPLPASDETLAASVSEALATSETVPLSSGNEKPLAEIAVEALTPAPAPSPVSRMMSLLTLGPGVIALRLLDQGRRRWTGRPTWQYSRITPQLYVGGQHRQHGWKAMGVEGITAVVNMREKHLDDARYGVRGNNHLHLATIDNTAPTMDDLFTGAKFIDKEIASGGKVYIHCGIGIGRAPTQAAAYLIYSGMTAADALALITSKRPFIHLTSKQRAQLDLFEATVKGQGKSDAPQPPQSSVDSQDTV